MNTQTVLMSFPLNIHSQSLVNPLTFAAVLLLHLLGLVWAAQQLNITKPKIASQSVVGVLVAPEPKPAPPPPKPIPTPPKPKTKPETKPKSVTPRPVQKPVSKPEPVREIAPEPVPQAAPSVPSPPAPPAPPVQQAAPALPAPAPVTPPHTNATRLNNPDPQYPALSRRLGEQGRVLLDVYILADGSVGEVKLKRSSGFPRLDKVAMQSVKIWKFEPAKQGDKPIPYWYEQPVSFELHK